MKYTTLFKDASDTLWFVGIYSNNFKDREGEIITWQAHQDYATWLKATGITPPVVVAHQPPLPDVFHFLHMLAFANGQITAKEFNDNMFDLYKSTAFAKTRLVLPMEGFMLVIAEVLEDKQTFAGELFKQKDTWGMSHGFITFNKHDNIIDSYHAFEFTVLPQSIAANEITPITIKGDIMTDSKTLTAKERDLLQLALGPNAEQDAQAALEKTREILSGFFDSKVLGEDTTPEEVVPAEAETAPEYAALRKQLFAELNVEGLTGVIKQLGETLGDVLERLTVLEKSEDEKIAEKFQVDWTLGLKNDSAPEEDAELLEELKENITGGVVDQKGQQAGDDNPLKKMFWDELFPSNGSN